MTASEYLAKKTPWAKEAATLQQQKNKNLLIGGGVLVAVGLAAVALWRR